MKKQYLTLIISLLLIIAAAVPAAAGDSPSLPMQLYGDVKTADGELAPVGTVIIANVGNENFTITVTTEGKYGGSGTFDDKLLIEQTQGTLISFYAGSEKASRTVTYESGKVQKVDLTFESFPVISPGGNTGGDSGNQGGTTVTPSTPTVQQPNDGISYVNINPGTGTFSYTTGSGAVFNSVNKMSVFGALRATSHTVQTSVMDGGIYAHTIDGKGPQGTSGWVYSVNGVFGQVMPAGQSVKHGDIIRFWYSENMESGIESSSTKFGIIIDTGLTAVSSIPSTDSPGGSSAGVGPGTQTGTPTPTPTQTILPEGTIPPSAYTITATATADATGMATLGNTETIDAVQVPSDILASNPGATVKVVEGNAQSMQLPNGISANDVSLIFDVSILGNSGQELLVTTPGNIIFSMNVPSGKQLAVGHKNAIGIWENCPVVDLGNGQWQVTYPSLSPFAVVLLDEGKANPFVSVNLPTDSTPTGTAPPTATQPAQSPLSILSLAGIAAGAIVLSRRR